MKYFDIIVDYPKDNHKVTTKEADSGKTYVRLEIDRKYNSEKKYNVPQRVTIGVLDENDHTNMHPNEKYKIYYSDINTDELNEENKRSQCLRTGGYSLIRKMFNDT
ncbi:MAG: hypothetical protein SO412_07210 [Erysipelotrichaceae bacterium]|nr:hypothetical protein [Erysipelotrichaceae bacterium]